jgi:hypothetical protein
MGNAKLEIIIDNHRRMNNMAKKTPVETEESAGPTNAKYVMSVEDLPRKKGGIREVGIFTDAPVGAVFSPKWLVDVKKAFSTQSAASAALKRHSRNILVDGKKTKHNPNGCLEQISRGTYQRVKTD